MKSTSTLYSFAIAIIGSIAVGAIVSVGAQESESDAIQQVSLRVEFYDLPAAEALRIQQEVSIQPDQTKAREQILAMVKAGEAAFISSAPLMGRSGSRAKYQDTEIVPVIEDFTWNEEAKKLVPKFANREVGTIFEVDPTISSDGKTLDLNFGLEHHTGAPETATILVPLGETGESKEVSVTRFHMKKITTRIYLKSGASALIGAFEITGPQDAQAETSVPYAKRLAFLCVDLQERAKE